MKRIRRFFGSDPGPALDQAVAWEFQHHIDECADELIAQGMSAASARAEAERRFGDAGRIRRELRWIDSGRTRIGRPRELVATLAQDVRHACRSIRQNAGFSAAVVLTLGLGVGANAAVFSVVDALLLRPLPYAEPQDLVGLRFARPGASYGQPMAWWDVADALRRSDHSFEGLMAFTHTSALYLGGAEPLSLGGTAVTADFEETLGVRPALGRGFTAEAALPGSPAQVIVSDAFWRSHLGADPEAIGRRIELGGASHEVIGVMPRGFKFPEYSSREFWVPIRDDGTVFGRTGGAELLARAPVATRAAAHARSAAALQTINRELGRDEAVLTLEPLEESRARNPGPRRAMWLLSVAVGLILLVAGVNTVNLLLIRGSARLREIAVRVALGATRARLVQQFTTEALVLALLSGVLAVFLALAALRSIQGIMPESITFFAPYPVEVERRTLLFTFAIAVGSGLFFGVLAALGATLQARPAAQGGLTVYAATTPGRSRLRSALVVAQVALSVVLLAGAGLFVNSFSRLMSVDPGMQLDGMAVVQLDVSTARHPDAIERGAYVRRLEERIEAIPGVVGVARSVGFPSGTLHFDVRLEAEGHQPLNESASALIPAARVTPEFFEVVGVRLIAGRRLVDADHDAEGGHGVVVDEDMARALWPAENPVGKRFRMDAERPWYTVVGVMNDIRFLGPDDRDGDFEVVYPLGRASGGYTTLLIRTAQADPRPLFAAIRAAVHEVGPDQPIGELATARELYVQEVEMPRFLLVLMAVLSAVGLSLSVIGIYGVVAYAVSRRTREFGIRLALGGRSVDLRRLVLHEGLALAGLGVVLGLAGALAAGRFVEALLFGVEPTDPLTLAAVAALMLTAALAACLHPARHATRADPVQALRAE